MKRISYYDNLKGILILSVILWHTLNICASFYDFDNSIAIVLSFFMIPLFIYTTGVFARMSKKKPIQRAAKMFLLFIVSQIIVTLYFKYVLGILGSNASIFEPRYTLWYLITCASLYLLEYLIRNKNFKKVFIITLLIGIFIGFVSFINDFMSISRTICFLPFFVLGYYSKEINFLEKIKNKSTIISFTSLIIIIFLIFNPDFFTFKDTYLKYSYFSYSTPLTCFINRILMYFIFIVFSMYILLLIPKKKSFLCTLGKNSLVIYLSHGVILKTVKTNELFFSSPIFGSIVLYISLVIFCLIIVYLIKKFKHNISFKGVFSKINILEKQTQK